MLVVGGLLGSAHCVGMCGGFALALGSSGRGLTANLRRQLTYCLGRVFTYTAGGAVIGYGGWRLSSLVAVVHVQALLCVAAGVLLIVQGLDAAGVLRPSRPLVATRPCLGPSLFAALLGATRSHSVFLAGVVNGLLPCGLVYAYLALAASSGDLLRGAATMALFGLGTVPALTLLGVGGGFASQALRRRVVTVAAWCVVLTGLVSIGRGISFLQLPAGIAHPGCPLCN
jgi:sulfite exporter TauE/SafE